MKLLIGLIYYPMLQQVQNLRSNSYGQNDVSTKEVVQKQKFCNSSLRKHYEYFISSITDVLFLLIINNRFKVQIQQKSQQVFQKHKIYSDKMYLYLYLSQGNYQSIINLLKEYQLKAEIKHIKNFKGEDINLFDFCKQILFNSNKHSIIKSQQFPIFQIIDSLNNTCQLVIKQISSNAILLINNCIELNKNNLRRQNISNKDQFSQLVLLKYDGLVLPFQDFISICYQKQLLHKENIQICTFIQTDYKTRLYVQCLFQDQKVFSNFVVRYYSKIEKMLLFKKASVIKSLAQKKIFEKNINLNDSAEKSFWKKVLQEIEEGDIFSLQPYWKQLSQQLKKLQSNWKYKDNLEKQAIKNLIVFLKNKIKKFRRRESGLLIYEYLYPEITLIIDELVQILQINVKNINKNPSQNIKDAYLLSYIASQLQKNQIKPWKYINKLTSKVITFQNLIDNINDLSYHHLKWQEIFDLVAQKIQNKYQFHKEEIQTSITSYFQRFPNTNCLGCTQFYYYDHTNLTKTLVYPKIYEHSFLKMQNQGELIQSICDMLNSNGGIVLFNCVRQQLNILPKGCHLTEDDKQTICKKFDYCIKQIYPKPKPLQIILTFVPVASFSIDKYKRSKQIKGYQGQLAVLKPNQYCYDVPYRKGYYVARIKVCSSDSSVVFFRKNTQENYYLDGFHSIAKLRFVIKSKFIKHRKNKYKNKTFGNPLNHLCEKADAGLIATEPDK